MASIPLVEAVRQEIAEIEKDIQDDNPQMAKLSALYKLLLTYVDGKAGSDISNSRISKETSEILNKVAKLLKDRELPMPTAHIAEVLRDEGVKLPGKDPVSSLSATLSYYSGYFEKVPKQGWKRKQ